MESKEETSASGAGKALQKREARKSLIFGLIVAGVIIALISVMMAIEIYGEKLNGEYDPPSNAAER